MAVLRQQPFLANESEGMLLWLRAYGELRNVKPGQCIVPRKASVLIYKEEMREHTGHESCAKAATPCACRLSSRKHPLCAAWLIPMHCVHCVHLSIAVVPTAN